MKYCATLGWSFLQDVAPVTRPLNSRPKELPDDSNCLPGLERYRDHDGRRHHASDRLLRGGGIEAVRAVRRRRLRRRRRDPRWPGPDRRPLRPELVLPLPRGGQGLPELGRAHVRGGPRRHPVHAAPCDRAWPGGRAALVRGDSGQGTVPSRGARRSQPRRQAGLARGPHDRRSAERRQRPGRWPHRRGDPGRRRRPAPSE